MWEVGGGLVKHLSSRGDSSESRGLATGWGTGKGENGSLVMD